MQKFKLLSSNALKLIACASMLIDHIGVMLFPKVIILRILGRIAFPIFAFMIAEGARHTKNKLRYLLTVMAFACVCQIGIAVALPNPYLCVLVTFSLSIMVIYALDLFKRTLFSNSAGVILKISLGPLFLVAVADVYILNSFSRVEYGFFGCMLPVLVSIPRMPESAPNCLKRYDTHLSSVILCAIGMALMLLDAPLGKVQLFSVLALPILLLYSGKKGKLKLKYFFYIFYPAHIVILALIAILVR